MTEKPLPQISIRRMLAMTAGCALAMFVVRQALFNDSILARCLFVVIATAVGCFLMYAFTFAVASLLAALTGTILEPLRHPSSRRSQVEPADDGVVE